MARRQIHTEDSGGKGEKEEKILGEKGEESEGIKQSGGERTREGREREERER